MKSQEDLVKKDAGQRPQNPYHKAMRCILYMLMLFPALLQAAEIRSVTVEAQEETARLHITMDAPYPPKSVFTLSNPPRVVVDVPKMDGVERLQTFSNSKNSWIEGVRGGQFNPTTTRIVLDVSQEMHVSHAVGERENSITLTLAPKESSSANIQDEKAPLLVFSRVPKVKGDRQVNPLLEPQRKPGREDRLPIVVIDAGHGGKDVGAQGKRGTKEKDITLNVAKQLASALETEGFRAILTRDDDTFLYLKDRVAFARAHHADIFISLHADASPSPDASGFSVYTLSDTASDAEAAALAEQENRSDIVDGLDLGTQDEDVAEILVSLIHRETQNASIALADAIIENMPKEVKRLRNPHRYANFRVLKAPDIPSVLIEMGFLTNGEDEQALKDVTHQKKFTDEIAGSIRSYLEYD